MERNGLTQALKSLVEQQLHGVSWEENGTVANQSTHCRQRKSTKSFKSLEIISAQNGDSLNKPSTSHAVLQ